MTGTLDQLYAAQNNRKMTIKPVVWLWCSDSGLYMVDYILEGAGWTLGVFDTLADAEKAVAAFNEQPAADMAAMSRRGAQMQPSARPNHKRVD